MLQQGLPALIIGLAKSRSLLRWAMSAISFRQSLFRFQQLGLRTAQLGFCFRRRDRRNDLSGRDLVALVHGQRRQPARIFRRYVHFRRFDAAVRFHDPLGHIAAAQAIYQRFYRCSRFFERILLVRLRVRADD